MRRRNSRVWLIAASLRRVALVIAIVAVGLIPTATEKQCNPDVVDPTVCSACNIPLTIPIDTYPKSGGWIGWSPDCRYFAVVDQHGPSFNRYFHYTVYEAATWGQVCEVGVGDIMAGMGMVGGYCELPLANGQTWVVVGGSPNVPTTAQVARFLVCDDPKTCISPDEIPPTYR